MANRLGDYVLYGEFRNTRNYCTHGYVVLRGALPEDNTVLHIDLTGNPEKDLRNKVIRFYPPQEAEDNVEVIDAKFAKSLIGHQIGVTGHMTAQGWVRTLPCSVDEFMRRAKLGEPPPTQWKDRLHLEWYSQNGRMLIEMAGAVVEEQVRAPEKGNEEDEGDWVRLPNLALPPEYPPNERAEPEVIVVENDMQAPRSAFAERPARGSDEEEDPLYEAKLMDDCLENNPGVPIGEVLGGVDRFPTPDTLGGDDEVEIQLKALLMELALLGICLDVCDHYTPRDCYRLLYEQILPESTMYPELIGTGWVQHMSTWEYCQACEDEFELELPPD